MVKKLTLSPLGRFKAVTLARLIRVRSTLLERYPERRQEVEEAVDQVAYRLSALRTKRIPSFVEAVVAISRAYGIPELLEVVPSEEELRRLLASLR